MIESAASSAAISKGMPVPTQHSQYKRGSTSSGPGNNAAVQSRCCPGSVDLTTRRGDRQEKTPRLHFATRLRSAVPLLVTREAFQPPRKRHAMKRLMTRITPDE